jgi:hypothetical protein
VNHPALAFRNLRRRPTRSVLAALGVALAVGSFITLYGLSRSVQENVQQSFEERGTDLTVRRRGVAEPFGGTMPQTIIPEIPGIAAVSGQLLSFAATLRPPTTTIMCSPSAGPRTASIGTRFPC